MVVTTKEKHYNQKQHKANQIEMPLMPRNHADNWKNHPANKANDKKCCETNEILFIHYALQKSSTTKAGTQHCPQSHQSKGRYTRSRQDQELHTTYQETGTLAQEKTNVRMP
jgi:hypothetical protein